MKLDMIILIPLYLPAALSSTAGEMKPPRTLSVDPTVLFSWTIWFAPKGIYSATMMEIELSVITCSKKKLNWRRNHKELHDEPREEKNKCDQGENTSKILMSETKFTPQCDDH